GLARATCRRRRSRRRLPRARLCSGSDMSREAIDRQLKRWNGLRLERSSYDQHWEELARFFMPRAGRFFRTKRNTKGGKQHQHILDSSGIRSMRVLAAGLM